MAAKSGRPPRAPHDIAAMRTKIADHALTLFRTEGFAAVSIRRLAREVGCAPMTIYAHFESKTDILRFLWADVLDRLFADIRHRLATSPDTPRARLATAATLFLNYWLDHPDHFRLVFMSQDITRADVRSFVEDARTLDHFALLSDLVAAAAPPGADITTRTDTLVAALIGTAMCKITIADYPWSDVDAMIATLVGAATA